MTPKQTQQIKQRNTSPKKAKKLMNYREDDPMCANCTHRNSYIKQQVFPSVHTVFTSMAFCKIGNFKVSMGGCCDMWENKEGETIDTN